jgi:hypothetical protein
VVLDHSIADQTAAVDVDAAEPGTWETSGTADEVARQPGRPVAPTWRRRRHSSTLKARCALRSDSPK